MEPAKYFDNVTLGQFALTGVTTKVFVNDDYLTITDVDDIEDPFFGFGMDVNGSMVPFDYRNIDHLLVGNNTITLDTYNKAMSGGASTEEPAADKDAEKEKTDETTMKLKPIIEKAVSKAQQKLFGAALSVKRGDTDTKQVSKDVATLAKSLSDKELAKFAGTKHAGLPEKKKEETNEDIGDTDTVSEPYMFQVGDIVNNVNPQCNHFGSMGIVQDLIDLPDEMGTLVKYMVTNHGGTYTPGMMLTKTMDQLAPVGPSVPDDMDYDDYDDDYDSGDYDDWDIVSGDGLDDDDAYKFDDDDED